MKEYLEYSHIKVQLVDVLREMDDFEETLTRALLRVEGDATEESTKQLIGRIQGVARVRHKLENVFGAQ